MLWEGYPKEEASWVGEEDITMHCCHQLRTNNHLFCALIPVLARGEPSFYMHHNRPIESLVSPYRVIADAASHLIAAVHRSLKSRVNCNNGLDLEFGTDIYRFEKLRTPQEEEDLYMTSLTLAEHSKSLVTGQSIGRFTSSNTGGHCLIVPTGVWQSYSGCNPLC